MPCNFPNVALIENSRLNFTAPQYTAYQNLFSKRQQIALMTLKNAIAELPEGTRTFFEDTLISIAHCGKYTDYRSKSQDNHCPENRLKETNLYHRFLEKLKERKEYIAAQNFDLNQLEVNSMDYRRFLRTILPNTVNLLLTDPPYGDNAQYFEHAQRVHPLMNYSLSTDNDRLHNEVVISNAPSRTDKHGKEQFLVDIERLFIEANRIVDDHGFMVLYFRPQQRDWVSDLNKLKDFGRRHGFEVLMITHKVLAAQQGYEKLLDILNDGLRDKEDPFLLFFMETVEPIYYALNTSDMQLLFDTLGIKRYPITKKAEKNKWKELQRQLDEARKKRAIDVFEIINRTKLIPIPPKLDGWYHLYQNTPETIYASNTSIEVFLNLDYAQFIAVKDFLHPEAQYSTEHGVKGEEYDNVIFVISKGWNQYQFETYAPMITKKAVIPSGKQASFERNRNLFYVCCSRPKKRLIFFVTVPIDSTFKSFLVELVGEQNIFTFSQYIERKID